LTTSVRYRRIALDPSFTPRLRPRRNTALSRRLPAARAAGMLARLPSTYREATITSASRRRDHRSVRKLIGPEKSGSTVMT
jgi:hypothetical protein